MPVQLNGQDFLASFSDVETGVWTPAIADGSLNGSAEGQVYSVQVGRYTKIGNRVFVNGHVTITDLGCLNTCESVSIVGLPFTSNSTTNSESAALVGFANSLAITALASITGIISPNTVHIVLREWDGTAGDEQFLISEFSVGGDIAISACYEV